MNPEKVQLIQPPITIMGSMLVNIPFIMSNAMLGSVGEGEKTFYIYHIAGTFERENFCELVKNTIFCGENFRGLLTCANSKDTTPQSSRRKLSRIAEKKKKKKNAKFVKVFSLESFLLRYLWYEHTMYLTRLKFYFLYRC